MYITVSIDKHLNVKLALFEKEDIAIGRAWSLIKANCGEDNIEELFIEEYSVFIQCTYSDDIVYVEEIVVSEGNIDYEFED